MKTLQQQLGFYQQQHRKQSTKITHYIGIPAIIFAMLILLNWFSLDIFTRWQISFAWLGSLCLVGYYFFLNVRLALLALAILVILNVIAWWVADPMPTQFSFIVFLILLIGGVILQFLGHYFEKNKPAFMSGSSQILVAPLFILIELLSAFGVAHFFIQLDKPEEPSQ